ncbi:MAG TPA: hydrogenase formation protein HypD [Candidatus Melainabacteria bacterium]|jgi:hydrogenase expression/formation protein HypD|nr:hydrogenase formation protein HypD [Candidatus Melainabacteria bacterium]HIN64360.1 hydrogenase formation protein HypD [Candidatus Obscuribacterales bacterium]
MRFVDEFRDEKQALLLADQIRKATTQPWRIMEVCGGQTHTIMQYGLPDLLPNEIELLHGPGCPVCVTGLELIDKAIQIASLRDVIFCSYGDMLRVPGSKGDLFDVKAAGGDVRIVYSPLDCLKIARENRGKRVVFLAIGFETTAPANAMAVKQAKKMKLDNFFLLCSHVTVPPVISGLMEFPETLVQGFLGPGHVCSVMGWTQYDELCQKYKIPIVVTGFEPIDILEGILKVVRQLEAGESRVENQYSRAVTRDGNKEAQAILDEVFDVCDQEWRGLGLIPKSGYKLKIDYANYDAEIVFDTDSDSVCESGVCISGDILKGIKKPKDCPAFGKQCTPEQPLGATMVSSEGTCAAYFRYGRLDLVV